MKKMLLTLSIAFILFSCDNGGVKDNNHGQETTYKIEYYSVRILATRIAENSPFFNYDYSYELIHSDEGSTNYSIADYNIMTDEWDWERPDGLEPFYGWAIDKPPHGYIGYATGIYNHGEKINVTADLVLYTLWGAPSISR